jgi:prepilin-type N-terminal cleavage/methylation domain-containing protein
MSRQLKPSRGHARPDQRAFTLIELLVVVAVIALLVSILLPSLAAAREQAKSVRCLSYLQQQGVAAYMYAGESNGYLPSSDDSATLERLLPAAAKRMVQLVSRGYEIFYCPSNDIRAWKTSDILSTATATQGRIRYWWLARPQGCDKNPPLVGSNAYNFLDTYDTIDSSTGKKIREKYIIKAEQKNTNAIAISTDQSRQAQAGWEFIHGFRQKLKANVAPETPAEALATGLTRSWKNNVYGDGHAAPVRANRVIARWGRNNPAGW